MPESAGFCTQCKAPKSRCICRFAVTVKNTLPVFVLQHSNERKHAKGTGRLLGQSLEQCNIIVGNTFHSALDDILIRYSPTLVFPKPSNQSDTASANSDESKERCLILIDATWKKALSIYFNHSQLHALPIHTLGEYKNNYHHRKSPSPKHLSTLEACCFALSELQPNNQHHLQQLLINQERMIRNQQKLAEERTFQRNTSELNE